MQVWLSESNTSTRRENATVFEVFWCSRSSTAMINGTGIVPYSIWSFSCSPPLTDRRHFSTSPPPPHPRAPPLPPVGARDRPPPIGGCDSAEQCRTCGVCFLCCTCAGTCAKTGRGVHRKCDGVWLRCRGSPPALHSHSHPVKLSFSENYGGV